MKTQLIKTVSLGLTLLASSYAIAGNGNTLDKNYDYAYYIMSPKNHQSNNGGEKSLRITAKSAETKSVNFQGAIEVPKEIKVNAALVRVGSSAAYLTFDNVQCKYETKVSKLFYNYYYPLVSCSDGSRAGDQVQVQQKISLYLKEAKIFPATAYATINVAATYVKGISLPQLDADKGQILRFDGELWVPEDYIPDGQAAGDVLVWDGQGWTASKITGVAGERGEKGEKGDTGAAGPQGPQGLTGPAGMVGPAGVQGAAGPQGPAGVAGATGAKGDKGDKGEAGAVGATGAIGPQGPAGAVGATGATGATGPVGPKGATGATGAQGPQGLAGADGAVGPQGPQGPAGIAGAKGDTGATGAVGPQGPQGPAGVAGATGAQGPQGVAGAAGAKGDKGEKGDAGDPGLVSLTAGAGILGGTISGNGGVIAVNTGTSAGQIPVIGTNGRLPASIVDTSQKVVYIKDVKANGTHGGTCDPAKAWDQVRDLNSVSGNTTFATLSANTITLAAGTYDIDISAPAYLDGFHKAALANAQTGEMVLVGSNARSHNVSGGMESSRIVGTITLAEQTSFVVKHRCATLSTSIGFGAAVSFGVDEVYTQVKIIKEK